MQMHDLKSPKGARQRKKLLGRGSGSGLGKTCGRGFNGQNSRPGRGILNILEGGQMPLLRRLPKVGFRSHNPTLYQVVNVGELSKLEKGTVVTAQILKKHQLISSLRKPFKILGDGELKTALTVQAPAISKAAKEKIEKAGGKVEIIKFDAHVVKEQPGDSK